MATDIEKIRREIVRVQVNEFEGRRLLDIRVYFPGEDGEMRPTGKGVAIALDKAEDLAAAILGEVARGAAA